VPETHNLNTPFQVQGVFWLPRNPRETFGGLLVHSRSGTQLTTSPVLKAIEGLSALTGDEAYIDTLYGLTTEGPCTLFWLQSPSQNGLTDLRTGQSLNFRQFRVGLCAFGLHILSSSHPCLTSASFSYSGISEWIPRHPQISETSRALTFVHQRDTSPVFDVCSRDIKSRVSFDIVASIVHRSSGEYHTSNHNYLVIEPSEPRSIEWLWDLASRFENLFSLLLGTSVCLLSVGVKNGDNAAWLIRRRKHRIKKTDPSVSITCDSLHLVRAVLLWLSTPDKFRSLENLIYGTIRNSPSFVETEFLSLAQAVESLHRLTDTSTITDPDSFKSVLESLQNEIGEMCGDAELATRLKESIEHANEPNFRTRVHGLLSRLGHGQCQQLLGDPLEFEQVLRQTRNYLTHPGIHRGSKVLTKTKELFLFNQKLHAFLRLLMLMHIGFAADEIFEPVARQSREWH
jgi:hypothetical protein